MQKLRIFDKNEEFLDLSIVLSANEQVNLAPILGGD